MARSRFQGDRTESLGGGSIYLSIYLEMTDDTLNQKSLGCIVLACIRVRALPTEDRQLSPPVKPPVKPHLCCNGSMSELQGFSALRSVWKFRKPPFKPDFSLK